MSEETQKNKKSPEKDHLKSNVGNKTRLETWLLCTIASLNEVIEKKDADLHEVIKKKDADLLVLNNRFENEKKNNEELCSTLQKKVNEQKKKINELLAKLAKMKGTKEVGKDKKANNRRNNKPYNRGANRCPTNNGKFEEIVLHEINQLKQTVTNMTRAAEPPAAPYQHFPQGLARSMAPHFNCSCAFAHGQH